MLSPSYGQRMRSLCSHVFLVNAAAAVIGSLLPVSVYMYLLEVCIENRIEFTDVGRLGIWRIPLRLSCRSRCLYGVSSILLMNLSDAELSGLKWH